MEIIQGDPSGGNIREVLEKAYERLLPSAAYLISSTAGFAASVVVFTTWLLRRAKKPSTRARDAIKADEELLVYIRAALRKAEERLERLERLYNNTGSEWERKRLERALREARANVESLMEEYELVELRLAAMKRLLAMGDEKTLRDAYKFIEKIEKGEIEEAQYRILKSLEERWRKREITLTALKKIVEEY